jgi:PmbA protein
MVRLIFSSKMRWWAALSKLQDWGWLAEAVIAESSRTAGEVEVYIAHGRFVSGELKRTVVGEMRESDVWSMAVRTIGDGRIGVASTTDPSRWKECLAAAAESACFATPQEWHGLPGPATVRTDLPLIDPGITVAPESAHTLLETILEGASRHPAAEVLGGTAGLGMSHALIANSSGAWFERERTTVAVSLEAISGPSTGYEYDRSCFLADIDAASVGEQAAYLASHCANATPMETGSYDVVLSPIALSALLSGVVAPALSGRNVKAGRSALADLLGKCCMDERISLYDDPFARTPGATGWDAEGMPTKRLDFVKQGVLQCFAYDLKTAYRYGEESTASAVRGGAGGSPSIGYHTLVIEGPGGEPCDEPAIWVHDLVGAHTANPVTGDFSVELANPIRVEGGEYGDSVRGAMLAGNVFAMLKDTGPFGKEPRSVGGCILPPVRFKNLQVIGT